MTLESQSRNDIPTWVYRAVMGLMIAMLGWFLVDNLSQTRQSVNGISIKTDSVMVEQQSQRVLIETIRGDVKVLQRSDTDTRETLKDIQKTQKAN